LSISRYAREDDSAGLSKKGKPATPKVRKTNGEQKPSTHEKVKTARRGY
jgi:hypothetical protein